MMDPQHLFSRRLEIMNMMLQIQRDKSELTQEFENISSPDLKNKIDQKSRELLELQEELKQIQKLLSAQNN